MASFWGNVWDKTKEAASWYDEKTNRDKDGNLGKLGDEADRAGAFATQGQHRFGELGAEATQERDYMRKVARGEESVSQVQLSQALQQNQAAQQSMAASARPGNAAMAARTAAMNAGRQGAGLAGQQAVAGIQERQAAQNALSQMLMQQRQQELSATQGARGQAIQGYGTAFTGSMGQPTGLEKGIQGGMDIAKTGIALFSDERLKENIEEGTPEADRVLRALKSYKYDYKDKDHGAEKQLGIMAQDLEKIGLQQAVIDLPDGKKAVHGAKLAGALASMLPGINKRLESLESK